MPSCLLHPRPPQAPSLGISNSALPPPNALHSFRPKYLHIVTQLVSHTHSLSPGNTVSTPSTQPDSVPLVPWPTSSPNARTPQPHSWPCSSPPTQGRGHLAHWPHCPSWAQLLCAAQCPLPAPACHPELKATSHRGDPTPGVTLGTWSEASISHLPDEQEAPYLGMAEAWQVGSSPTCWEDRYPTPSCALNLVSPVSSASSSPSSSSPEDGASAMPGRARVSSW